jgi:hypothetical protein
LLAVIPSFLIFLISILRLTINRLGTEGGKAIAELLLGNNALTYLEYESHYPLKLLITILSLSRNSIGPEGAKAIAIALVGKTSLTYLE